ncbi:MAG: hypothetical protein KL863_15050 [Rhizobium sp.]|nr:hypothetical protein [Rhizobium sp.]
MVITPSVWIFGPPGFCDALCHGKNRPRNSFSSACAEPERQMNVPFRAISADPCSIGVKFAERLVLQCQSRLPISSNSVPAVDDGFRRARAKERMMTMMYATLTLMAALIAVMFIATAVSSIVNAIREGEAVKRSRRHAAAH